MSDNHFATHYSDLYIYPEPSVHNALVDWLAKNYEFYGNITWFTSQEGSNWAGAGKRCMDVPFANSDYFDQRSQERREAFGDSQ